MENRVVAFCGGMAAGKDTYGDLYKEYLESQGKVALTHSFGKPVKDEINAFLDDYRKNLTLHQLMENHNLSKEDCLEALDIIKKDVRERFDIKATDRTPAMRKLLQFWGTGVRRKQKDSYWVDKMESFIKSELEKGHYIIITDARFNNEFEMIKRLGGTLVRLLATEDCRIQRIFERDGIQVPRESLSHPSETGVLHYNGFTTIVDTEKGKINEVFEEILSKLKELER